MTSQKEPEEEVDHSFFDSDCEVDSLQVSENAHPYKPKSSETNDVEAEKETDEDQLKGAFQRRSHESDDPSNQRDSSRQNMNPKYKREHPTSSRLGLKISEQKSQSHSVSSHYSDEESVCENDVKSCVHDKTNDEDGFHHSGNECGEAVRSPVSRSIKHKAQGTSKKCVGIGKSSKFSRSHSSSSDSSSDSSNSSKESNRSSSQNLLSIHQHEKSAKLKEQQTEASDSEDTVTDVTPLSTPSVSPSQSIDVTADVPQLHSIDEDNNSSDNHYSLSSEGEEEEGFLKVDKQLDRALVISSPGSISSSRKNYSFTNDEVRRIDRENNRLLHELSRASAGSRCVSSACSKSTSCKSIEAPIRLYHTGLNRQREQERIQKENLAFLKRLEAVKPTPGMTREDQLSDYQRQCRYLGTGGMVPSVRPKSGRTSRQGSSPRKNRAEPQNVTKPPRVMPRPAWS